MAAGRTTWLRRSLGLALARRSLRRCLATAGPAVLAAVLGTPAVEAPPGRPAPSR